MCSDEKKTKHDLVLVGGAGAAAVVAVYCCSAHSLVFLMKMFCQSLQFKSRKIPPQTTPTTTVTLLPISLLLISITVLQL